MPLAKRVGIVLSVMGVALAVIAFAAIGLALYIYSITSSLPDLSAKEELRTQRNTVVYAADGSVLAEWHGDENRTIVPLEQVPPHLRDAVVAIEDRRFYEHRGVDLQGLMRAAKTNAEQGEIRQGGSTITQQLVKILFTEGERTLGRKVREALLAFQLETLANKDEVLGTYLNTVYFGNGSYGVESAARRYFNRGTADLSLAQSALLAGIIRYPSGYDPVAEPDAALQRRTVVLQQMREQGYISREEAAAANAEELQLAQPQQVAQFAPYFVEYVKKELLEKYGPERVYGGGLRVYTTLEPQMQRAAERAATVLAEEGDPSVAVVSLRYDDGSVVAMVGGKDFSTNQFNLASQGRRQPGSAFKPFVLVTALEKGIKPEQTFSASPYSVAVKDGIWNVQNYENSKTRSSVTLHAATNWSVNVVYARLIMDVGPENVVKVAEKMGIMTPLEPDPAIALGGLKVGVSPLEMASAYGTIGNGGYRVAPTGILRVTDDDGRVVYQPDTSKKEVLSKAVAMKASLMLHDVVEKGTGQRARFGKWAAGKTGTTQSYHDAWFVGWSEGLATAVWVGHPEAQVEMTNVHGTRVTGGSFPAEIWNRYMKEATRLQPKTEDAAQAADQSQQVMSLICRQTMKLANMRCPEPVEIWLTPSMVPRDGCTLH